MTALESEHGPGLLEHYLAKLHEGGAPVDDLMVQGAQPPPHLAGLSAAVDAMGMPGLMTAAAEARRLVHEDAVTYGSTESGRQARNWVIDPIPVIISAEEWDSLTHGLAQRAHLLDAILRDLYGPRTLIKERVIPAEVVLAHGGFIRQADGIGMHAERALVMAATDLARRPDGSWQVIADRSQAISGIGYAMANRRITSRVMAGIHRQLRLTRMRPFFHTMTHALRGIAPADVVAPQVVVMSPGSGSETAYDQSILATLLGFPLVEGGDLTVRNGRVWIRNTQRPDQVDVVLRRVDFDYSDPLELRSDSQLGLAGLIEATRNQMVSMANHIGSGVLENPGLMAYLPQISQHLLGEAPVLQPLPSWWCGDSAARSHVLTNLDSLMIRPLTRQQGDDAIFGWKLSQAQREDFAAQIEAEPWNWCAQARPVMSTTPVVSPQGLEPRPFVLRTFGVADGADYEFLPGGLGRAGGYPASPLVSSMRKAVAKDVWVLAPEPGHDGVWDPVDRRMREEAFGAAPAALAPRLSDNLYWIGRYASRAENTTRLLRVVDDLVEDHFAWPKTPGGAVMEAMLQASVALTGVPAQGEPIEYLRRLVSDVDTPGTLAFATNQLITAAQDTRDLLATDIWHILARLERELAEQQPIDEQLQPQLLRMLESMLAIDGVLAESMMRDDSWGYLDAGLRMERAQHTLALLRATIAHDHPPIIDAQLIEAVLESCETIITHRRRTATGEGPAWPLHSALSLLVFDETNPRSIAYALVRLTRALGLVNAEQLAEEVDGIAATLSDQSLQELIAGDRVHLGQLLGDLDAKLRGVHEKLQASHFRRKGTQRTVPSSWYGGQ